MPRVPQVRRLIFNDEEIGMGFNSESGLAVGTALEQFSVQENPTASGQEVAASIRIINSHEDDLEFAKQNPAYYDGLPADDVLAAAVGGYTRLINAVVEHAVRLSRGQMSPPRLFDPAALTPPLAEPAPVPLRRVRAAVAITGSVGRGGLNLPADARLVQQLLNEAGARDGGGAPLMVDGVVGPKTLAAILDYQRRRRLPVADGRVDPGGATFRSLVADTSR